MDRSGRSIQLVFHKFVMRIAVLELASPCYFETVSRRLIDSALTEHSSTARQEHPSNSVHFVLEAFPTLTLYSETHLPGHGHDFNSCRCLNVCLGLLCNNNACKVANLASEHRSGASITHKNYCSRSMNQCGLPPSAFSSQRHPVCAELVSSCARKWLAQRLASVVACSPCPYSF